jgi:FkbM family methyltransferase
VTATVEIPRTVLRLTRHYIRYFPLRVGKRVLLDRVLNPALKRWPVFAMVRTRQGLRLPVTTEDIHQRYLYMSGHWEPSLTAWLTKTLRPGDGFIDIGANLGYFSLLAAQLVGAGGRVLAIEASPAMYASLLGNLTLNKAGNVRAVNGAVGDKCGELVFYQPRPGNPSAATIVAQTGAPETFRVAARPLPELATESELRAARVIKIDVEGAEHLVVKGLAASLASLRADVELVVEVNPDALARQSVSVPEMLAPLTAAGFHAYELVNSYRPSRHLLAAASPPVRVREPITTQADLVFSRTDSESL